MLVWSACKVGFGGSFELNELNELNSNEVVSWPAEEARKVSMPD